MAAGTVHAGIRLVGIADIRGFGCSERGSELWSGRQRTASRQLPLAQPSATVYRGWTVGILPCVRGRALARQSDVQHQAAGDTRRRAALASADPRIVTGRIRQGRV